MPSRKSSSRGASQKRGASGSRKGHRGSIVSAAGRRKTENGGSRSSSAARRSSSVSTSSKNDGRDGKVLKSTLKETQSQLQELQSRLEKSEPREVVEQKERALEALKKQLEEEIAKRDELAATLEQDQTELSRLGQVIQGQRGGFEAEKKGYINSITLLTRTCCSERLVREEERIGFIEKVASLQSQEEWLETALASVQDKKWLQFDSEDSKMEYDRLFQRYGSFLGRKEDGLRGLWEALGKSAGWKRSLRASQLQLLLSRETYPQLTFRVGTEHHMELGGTVIAAEEVRGFLSCLLSRIQRVDHLALLDCPNLNPLDWDELSMIPRPFPELKSMALWHTKLCAHDVVELVRRLPALQPCGFSTIVNGLSLHESCLDLQDYSMKKLTDICQRKLWVWGAMIADVSNITAAMQSGMC